jgi:hypothetical protein
MFDLSSAKKSVPDFLRKATSFLRKATSFGGSDLGVTSSFGGSDFQGKQVSFTVNNVHPVLYPSKKRAKEQWFVRSEPRKKNPKLVCPDACSQHPGLLDAQSHTHGFIAAIAFAFDEHRPLVLRPDHFWTLILQAVAKHVNSNAEKLRADFVNHKGKKVLEIVRDKFRMDVVGNDWPGVVEEFSQQITNNVTPGTAELLAADFSTTTQAERVGGQVTVMNMLQEFFEYKIGTRCGFPKITLEGTSQDWHALVDKTEKLVRGKCLKAFADFWLPAVVPVLKRIAGQYDSPETVDVCFWQSFCKRGGIRGSGGHTWLNGWFNVFFPNLKPGSDNNRYCVPYDENLGYSQEDINGGGFYGGPRPPGVTGPDIRNIPGGMCSAPVTWVYFGEKIPLQFRAGFVGAAQREDGAFTPDMGWFICHKQNSAKNTGISRKRVREGGSASISRKRKGISRKSRKSTNYDECFFNCTNESFV